MSFPTYSIEDLQARLREENIRHEAAGRVFYSKLKNDILLELIALDRYDVFTLEERRTRLSRLGYDADSIVDDAQAGRDVLQEEAKRQPVRELVSNERKALFRLARLHRDHDGSPARYERRREIRFKAGALRARRAVEMVIAKRDFMWMIDKVMIILGARDEWLPALEDIFSGYKGSSSLASFLRKWADEFVA